MSDYILVSTVVFFIVAIWYFNWVTAKSEFERGYLMGKEHIHYSLQLKALRQHLGQSLEQVSKATGLETDVIKWVEENDYKELRKFDYFQVTDILFSHYGEDKNTASVYVQFDDKVVRLKPCNGFQSLNKRCSLKGKCSIPASGLMVIQEPKG